MKPGVTIFILFVGFMFIGSFSGLYLHYISAEHILIKQTNEYFEAIAKSRANHIEDFLDEHKKMVELLAFSAEYSDINKIIKIHSEFYEVFILDKNGKVVATTNPEEEIGTDFSEDLSFLDGREKTYVKDAFYDEEFGKGAIAISTPIFNKTKEFSGVFIVKMEIKELNKITLDRTGLGETGQIYLINKDSYMITPSRFLEEEETFLKLKVNTTNSRHCLSMIDIGITEHAEHKLTHDFLDYRGIEVLGIHAYIPEIQWCVLAEIDEAEVLGVLRNELLSSILIILIIIAILMVFFVFISGRLVRKIIKQARSQSRKGKTSRKRR